MKIIITAALFAISVAFAGNVKAQSKADKIIGYYLTYAEHLPPRSEASNK